MGFIEDLIEFNESMTELANTIRGITGVSVPLNIRSMIGALEGIQPSDPIVEVEYIKSTGTQYIDTEVIPTNNTTIEIDFMNSSIASAQALFGSGQHFCCSLSPSGGGVLWNYPSNAKESNVSADTNGRTFSAYVQSTRYVLKLDKGVIYKDGVECYKFPQSTFTGQFNLGLFCQIRDSVIDYKGTTFLYSCKIWENDVLIRDYVPAKKSDRYGLLDRVNQKFYGSESDDEFTGA